MSFVKKIAKVFDVFVYSRMEYQLLKAFLDILDPQGTIFCGFAGK